MVTSSDIEAEAARPMEWFQHDADASQDMKVEQMLEDWGMAGYGMWWRLCELLCAENGHRLEVGNPRIARIVARRLMLRDEGELMAFLRDLAEIGLIVMDGDGHVSSRRMDRNAERFGTNRANGKLGGRPRKSPVKTDH